MIKCTERSGVYQAVKRLFDILASLAALAVLSPLFLVIAILILSEDGRPVFYKHTRVGKGGKNISDVQIPHNVSGPEDRSDPGAAGGAAAGVQAGKRSPCDRIGSKLRMSSLDELPQLLNILKGDMSFVGPRPIMEREFEFYTPAETAAFQSVKPGLTGYWQAYARNDATYQSGERQAMEMYYVKNVSPWLDIRILFKTVGAVLRKSGVK